MSSKHSAINLFASTPAKNNCRAITLQVKFHVVYCSKRGKHVIDIRCELNLPPTFVITIMKTNEEMKLAARNLSARSAVCITNILLKT